MRWMDEQEQASRKNARVIDKVMVALPIEFDAVLRAELIRDFAETVTSNRTPWVAAMHDMGKDAQNPHAHFIFRDRDIETGKRVMRLSDSKRDREKAGLEPNGTDWLRQVWELKANAALERAGREERIDRRTLEAQGIDREPGLHVGPKANELERERKVPPSQVRYDERGREIHWPEIDCGVSRATFNNQIKARNRIALDGKAANDDFKKEVGRAWDVLKRKQVRDLERAKEQQAEAEKREREVLQKRQKERQATEHASDERKRPKGLLGMFARLTGRKQRIEAEIAEASRKRLERDRLEWSKLETRQTTQHAKMMVNMRRVFEQEKLLFKAEAKRIHKRAMQDDRGRGYDKERDKDREEDEGRDGFGGPPGPKLRLDPPRR